MTIDTKREKAMNGVMQATKILNDLTSRRDGARVKAEEIANGRRLVAYAASTGDADANNRLEALKRQGVGISSELETLEFALKVAREKLHSAEQTQATEIERENRKKMLKRAEALRSSAAQLDNDAAKVVEGYNRFLREAAAVGLVRLHPDLVRVGSRRSLLAHFQQTGITIERLAPSEKRTFSNLADAWTARLDR
jgi:predicted  nucleic acid-binding Zn-ribbon protein